MQKLLLNTICLFRKVPVLFVLIFVAFHSQAAVSDTLSSDFNDRKVTLSFVKTPLRVALRELGEKSGLGITYNDGDVREDHLVTCAGNNITVENALLLLLQNTGLSFREYKGNVIIYRLPPRKTNNKGELEGKLYDKQINEPLIGASVKLVGTSLGALSDVNGVFLIRNIPEGIYEVTISYIGYETLILREVKIYAGQTTSISPEIRPSSTELQSVEIIGDKALSGNVVITNETSLVNAIKSSSLIITGISAQQIARSVDQDAGEVVRRLPGVSISNNFVNIRGMHERYNLTYLNGMVAPSSESDRRAFSYDLLPSNMIDKMTAYRSPGPELLGDWAGGVIKIETKNTSIARQLEVNFSTWYRPGSNFKDYYTYQGGNSDWLGKDDGTRALPGNFPEVGAIPAGPLTDPIDFRSRGDYTAEELAANAKLSKQLYNKWNMKKAHAGADYRIGFNYYDAWRLGKMRVSNLTSINTTQSKQIINRTFVPYQLADNEGNVNDYSVYNDTLSRVAARWGLLQNLAIHINSRHSLELKGLYNRLGTDEVLVRDGYEGLTDLPGMTRSIIYTYKSRAIGSAQLAGQHILGESSRHTVRWSGGYSYSSDDVPAMRGIENIKKYKQALLNSPNSVENSLFYSNTKEHNFTYTLDYEVKIPSGIFFRAGAFFEDKSKKMQARMINVREISAIYESDTLDEFNYEKAFRPEVFKEDGTGAYITENNALSGQFDVSGKIYAGYVAANVSLFAKRLNIYGGLRYEGQQVLLRIPPSRYLDVIGYSPTLVDDYYPFFLPSVNASWNFTPKVAMRLAYGKTLNRPNYRELIPMAVIDPNYAQLKIGNDSLKTADIHNFDLRLEYYPGEGEFISIGAFYKKLHDAIEAYVKDKATLPSNERVYFNNTPKAIVYGLELEARKNLGSIPWKEAKRFSIIANAALLHSEVSFENTLFPKTSGDFSDSRTAKRSLEGTARYVVNAALYYEQEEWGTKLSVLYNVLGQRLVFAGTSIFPETYELPRHVIDFTVRQRLSKNIELRGGVQDILNQASRLYRDYDRDQKWNPGRYNKLPFQDWMFQQYKPGSYYMLGVNFTL